MTPIVITIIVILIVGMVVALVMMIKYTTNQNLRCPHCQLEFTTDLFMIMDNALLACPFCRRWVLVTRTSDRYTTKKLFV